MAFLPPWTTFSPIPLSQPHRGWNYDLLACSHARRSISTWIDRSLAAGKTFRYGSQTPEGLADNKIQMGVSKLDNPATQRHRPTLPFLEAYQRMVVQARR
jgi:hypothetical protein